MAKVLKINDAGWLLAETSRTPGARRRPGHLHDAGGRRRGLPREPGHAVAHAAHLPAAVQLPPQEPAGTASLGAARRRGHRPRLPPAPLRRAVPGRRARARRARLAAALLAAGPDLPAVGVPRHRGRGGAAVVDVHEGPPLPDRRRRRDPPGQPHLLGRPRGPRDAAALGRRHPRRRPVRPAAADQGGREGRHRRARLVRSAASVAGSLASTYRESATGSGDKLRAVPWRAPRSVFNVPHQQAPPLRHPDLRRWTGSSAVAKAADGSLNDVFLSICGGALRRYLLELDKLPVEQPHHDRAGLGAPGGRRRGQRASPSSTPSSAPTSPTRWSGCASSTSPPRRASPGSPQAGGATMDAYTAALMTPFLGQAMLGVGGVGLQAANVVISNVPGTPGGALLRRLPRRGVLPAQPALPRPGPQHHLRQQRPVAVLRLHRCARRRTEPAEDRRLLRRGPRGARAGARPGAGMSGATDDSDQSAPGDRRGRGARAGARRHAPRPGAFAAGGGRRARRAGRGDRRSRWSCGSPRATTASCWSRATGRSAGRSCGPCSG